MILHNNVLDISFAHRHQIKSVFGDILGLEGIEHFSLDLVNPNGEMLFFLEHLNMLMKYAKEG